MSNQITEGPQDERGSLYDSGLNIHFADAFAKADYWKQKFGQSEIDWQTERNMFKEYATKSKEERDRLAQENARLMSLCEDARIELIEAGCRRDWEASSELMQSLADVNLSATDSPAPTQTE